jgi:hypothetical protein
MVIVVIVVMFAVLLFGPCVLASHVNLDLDQPQQTASSKPTGDAGRS